MKPFSSIIFIWSIFSVAYAQSIVSRISGGEPTAIENFPYQISLQENGRHTCGGGIIGRRFILTAAHCVADSKGNLYSSQFNVVAGTSDLKNSTNDRSVKVEKIYIPRSYTPSHSADDIAVLKLEKDLDFSRGLSILELPINDQNYVGQVAKVAGYGWTWIQNWKRGHSDHILRYLNVKIISNSDCRWQFREFVSIKKQRIHDSNICGQALPQHAGNSAGVCRGDSGSPLVIGNTVIGITNRAGSTLCREDRMAARYSRVSSFLEFVNNVLTGDVTDDIVVIKLRNLTADAGVLDKIYYPKDKK